MIRKICRCHNDLWRNCCARAQLPAAVLLSIRSLLRKAYTVGHHRDPCKSKKSACKPGSVEGNHSSMDPRRQGPLAAYPEARTDRRCLGLAAAAASLFGLAPRGVYLAVECCHRRGALLPHRFTLTGHHPLPGKRLRRSVLCCTFRGLAPPRRYLARYPREPGLSSTSQPMERSDCPADFTGHHTPVIGRGSTAAPDHTHRIAAPRPARRRSRRPCPAAARAPAAPARGA
jgi:hypothetical protein